MPNHPSHARAAYESWHRGLGVDEDSNAPWHQLLKRHLQTNGDVAGRRMLEIGCGRGGFSYWLAAQRPPPARVVAVDFSATAVGKAAAHARAQGSTVVDWLVGDIESIPHPDASFDLVVSCETIEHVPQPQRALRELARVLRPGGRLYLTCPNYFSLMGWYRIYLWLRRRPFTEEGQPINQFLLLPRTRAWVAGTGLRVLAVDASGFYLPWPGRPLTEVARLGRPRWLMRWFGYHSLIVAEKPQQP